VSNLFSVLFVHYETEKEYRALIEHSGVFITSDPDLDTLKSKVEEYLFYSCEKVMKNIKLI
jgi:hypothetical protein